MRYMRQQMGKQPDQADENQVGGDQVIQDARQQQNQNAENQRHKRLNGDNIDHGVLRVKDMPL